MLQELLEMLSKTDTPKVRKRISGYGQLGTKYEKKPKFRDKPRNNKVRDY